MRGPYESGHEAMWNGMSAAMVMCVDMTTMYFAVCCVLWPDILKCNCTWTVSFWTVMKNNLASITVSLSKVVGSQTLPYKNALFTPTAYIDTTQHTQHTQRLGYGKVVKVWTGRYNNACTGRPRVGPTV